MENKHLWSCREHSTLALTKQPLSSLRDLLSENFERIDEAIDYFQKFLSGASDPAGRVCALVVIKGRNLALSCYSLALDGLAQESGAMLRPLMESIELLIYLRQIQGAVDEALDGKLPAAGKRAAKISSGFRNLREFLNESASHVDFDAVPMSHLIDTKTGTFRVVQQFREATLQHNLATVVIFAAMLAHEAAVCFHWFGHRVAAVSAESLLTKSRNCYLKTESVAGPIIAKP